MKTGDNTTAPEAQDKFKRMAVELSVAKGQLKATAEELGITQQILTRWYREHLASKAVTTGERGQVSYSAPLKALTHFVWFSIDRVPVAATSLAWLARTSGV